MKEMRLSRPKWTSPGWPRRPFGGRHHRRHAACVALKPGRPPLPGDGSVTATCPVDDVHYYGFQTP